MNRRPWILLPVIAFAACATPQKAPSPPPPVVVAPVVVTPPTVFSTVLQPVPDDEWPTLNDDGDAAGLRHAVQQSLAYYQTLPAGLAYVLGRSTYTVQDLRDTLADFDQLLSERHPSTEFRDLLRRKFDLLQSPGTDADRTVVFSSYYEPTFPARLTPDAVYKYPIYARPPDLVDVDLSLFSANYTGAKIQGRVDGRNFIPYYKRADIDSRGILRGKGLELAWAKDLVDIFGLQTEGSGWLDLGGGQLLRIRYDGNNGRKYSSVGQYMIRQRLLPESQMSHRAFQNYLNTHPQTRQSILNVNERYIFFQVDRSSTSVFAYGNIHVPLTPWRSIALDPKIFPRGALAWISTDKAVFDRDGRVSGSAKLERFVVAQDEGGAIQGPGRVDYFAGNGDEAERFATNFWKKGKLFFLVKKPRTAQ